MKIPPPHASDPLILSQGAADCRVQKGDGFVGISGLLQQRVEEEPEDFGLQPALHLWVVNRGHWPRTASTGKLRITLQLGWYERAVSQKRLIHLSLMFNAQVLVSCDVITGLQKQKPVLRGGTHPDQTPSLIYLPWCNTLLLPSLSSRCHSRGCFSSWVEE